MAISQSEMAVIRLSVCRQVRRPLATTGVARAGLTRVGMARFGARAHSLLTVARRDWARRVEFRGRKPGPSASL